MTDSHADAAAANRAWAVAAAPMRRQLERALADPESAQRERLLGYVRRNAATDYGRRHDFQSIRDVETFQSRVPIVRYEDLIEDINRIGAGQPDVFTAARVLRLVPTGGSTGGAKLLPFTAGLGSEIAGAVDAWMSDIYEHHPGVLDGRAYWSITPPAAFRLPPRTRIPVGFGDDGAYLGAERRALAARVMAVPAGVAALGDADACRYATLAFLMRAPDLRLVSVWHPSFFAGLLDLMIEHFDRLTDDIATGWLRPPRGHDDASVAALQALFTPDRARADALRRSGPSPMHVWPTLALVSCWADGASAGAAAALGRRLPGVFVQPKGLMATEGVVSIPVAGRHPLAVLSHVFEFADDDGRLHLAHELRHGKRYRVIVTTGAGLYRYDLGDRVEVAGFVESTPSVRFVGRGSTVSDLFGEKLTDEFVAGIIAGVFRGVAPPAFAMLAPERDADGARYVLFVEPDHPDDTPTAAALEKALRGNPHYAWCVDLGQLKPARVVRTPRGSERRYVDACVANGQRLGDVKAVALHADTGWTRILTRDPST